jgi:regulatory protein
MKITKLEPSQHKPGRWLVWFEDGSLLRIGEGDVVSLCLYAGKDFDEQEAAALTAAAEHSKLNERAVELLSARAMSRKELVDKLSAPTRRRKKPGDREEEPDGETLALQRETLRAAAGEIADRMERLGLLNDEEYGRAVARHYSAKGFGIRKIRDELYRRGVPREFWDAALSELSNPEESGTGRLDELVRKKLGGGEPTRENLKKVSDYLARRGFGWEEISAALEHYRMEE